MRIAMTGAASGIGAALLDQALAAGHEVVALDLAEPAGGRWLRCDLGDPASIDAALAKVEGPCDALVCNAGLPPREGRAAQVLNVNFLGYRHVVMGMLDRMAPGGAIVGTASRAGAMWQANIEEVRALLALEGPGALPGFVEARGIDHVRAYNLSKEAVIAWSMGRTEALLARGLRINTVSPAAVSTGILEDFTRAFGPRVARNIARAGRPGTPEEAARAILWLASPESGWIKGQDIVLDGGMAAMAQADALGLG